MDERPAISEPSGAEANSAGELPQDGSSYQHSRRRRRHIIYFDLTDTADRSFDWIIEALLLTLLAFAPLAIGGVQAWSEAVICALAGAMAVLLGVKLIARPGVRFVWAWSYVPVALFLLITLAQVIPLPASLIQAISPQTAELRRELLAPLPLGEQALHRMTLSLYPEATLHDLRMLLAICAVYVVTLNVIRQQAQIERLLKGMTIIGVAVAGICFVHLLAGATRIYGLYGHLSSGWPIAPFINRNHFGQFMNLSLGAALGLLLMQVERMIRARRGESVRSDVLSQVPPIVWAAAAAVVALGLGTFLSLSRGAIVSLAIAGCAATFAARRQGMRGRIWVLAPLAWAIVLLVAIFGFDTIVGRFALALDPNGDHSAGGRLTIVRDVVRAWRQFPVLGTGMGSFQTTYPMFDTSTVLEVASHAEDEYAQILLEAGAAGLIIVLAFLALIWRKYAVCVRSAPSLMASIAIGLGFSLLAVLIQSFTDFGQHAPANAMLAAVVCALIVTLAQASGKTRAAEPAAKAGRMMPRLAATALVAVVFAGVLAQAWSCAQAESDRFAARAIDERLWARDWRGDSQDYVSLLSASAAAAQQRPRDVYYQYWLAFYRWQAISRNRDQSTGQLLLDEDQLQWAGQIARDLYQAAPLCPTYGPVYLLAGEIEKNILQKPQRGSVLIKTALRLSRTDPAANFEAALLAAHEGQWETAMAMWGHAAALDQRYLLDAVDVVTRDLHRPDLAMQLAGQDVRALRRIVSILEQSQDAQARDAANARLVELIQMHAEAPGATADELIDAARLEAAQKRFADAVGYYRRALQVLPGRADWRLELARAYAG
ncbi:MAG TPA: O-antigen ligase family protein, partial [Dongiaceae bacterium]|nr:O-antigen ligase family protein [Dongiaceae bacterium]